MFAQGGTTKIQKVPVRKRNLIWMKIMDQDISGISVIICLSQVTLARFERFQILKVTDRSIQNQRIIDHIWPPNNIKQQYETRNMKLLKQHETTQCCCCSMLLLKLGRLVLRQGLG